jgi:tetratricopeptide (TPR) repeat protein/polyferredoxin
MPADAPQSAPPRSIRRSRAGRWRAVALLGVHLLIAAHLTHWWLAGRTLSPLEPSEAMELARHSLINAGLVFFAATILLTAVAGRFFCGWGCHLVALQDGCRWLLGKVGIRPRPFRSRLLLWVPAVAFVYMFVWPAVYRLLRDETFSPWRVELTTTGFWDTFPGWAVGSATFVVCGFVAVYLLGAKGFCSYACPYGAAFAWADRLSPLRIRVSDACAGCAHCTAVCSSNVRVHEEVAAWGMVTSPGCMKCLDCVSVCPNDALRVGLGRPALLARLKPGRDAPPRRAELSIAEELLAAGAFAAFFFVVRGLYGWFPFLLSLGLSAVVAWVALHCLRLGTRTYLRLGGRTLQRDGAIRPAGFALLAIGALVAAFWFHSAIVRYHMVQGERLYRQTAPLREAMQSAGPAPEGESLAATATDRLLVHRARVHLQRVDRWGLAASPPVRMRLAWLALLEGDEERFEAEVERVFSAAPESVGPRIRVADHYRRRGRPAAAEEFYLEALDLDPSAAAASLNLGSMWAAQGRFEEAAALFDAALALDPEVPELAYNAALAEVGRRRPEAAVELFERALALDPEMLEARENLAGLLCALGRFDAGIVHFEEAVRRSPDDPETRLLLARAYRAIGETEAAREQEAAARRTRP